MALKSKVEAAMALGFSVELVEKLVGACPKAGDSRLLRTVDVNGEPFFEETELSEYRDYLRRPWPRPPGGGRPHLPDYIKEDVRAESHYLCAFCGCAGGGEVAHIDPVAETLDNSPDNLLYVCPNHHTAYDYGHYVSRNIDRDEVMATKRVKRASRIRVLRYEANATAPLVALVKFLASIEKDAAASASADMRQALAVEARHLITSIPNLLEAAKEAAARDGTVADAEAAILSKAPQLAKLAMLGAGSSATEERDIRSASQRIVEVASAAIADLDEVDCPHCQGRGLTGLVGDLCKYCRGRMVVTEKDRDDYDAAEIDEADCPHCRGAGTIGIADHLCPYCRGGCVVTREKLDAYNEESIDEATCPHCEGTGTTGLDRDYCKFCHGRTVVSRERADAYDREAIDEVDCPRCDGAGTTGLVRDYCAYCHGSQVVTKTKADAYDPDQLREVACPHCDGSGLGGGDYYCSFCGGSCFVSRVRADSYDRSEIDEADCPRCDGRGEIGFGGHTCPLCRGRTLVTRDTAAAYRSRHPNRGRND